MFLLESLVFLPEGVDTVNRGLNKLDLGVSQPVLVGDVIAARLYRSAMSEKRY